ncbi:MAG: endonuclease III [Candidatus Aminicenantes bacterium]|nr:endonuclease III [Candidatus Aminicenantes bacterium]
MARKSEAEKQARRDLGAIRRFTAPLSPPVDSFEASIRSTPFRILISVLLSARTKDPVTEKAAARLFAAADTPDKMGHLSEAHIGRLIYPVGFYRTKAKHILGICQVFEQGERFPSSLDELLELPGIGRKSANLVLALAFAQPAIAVDTHVFRIARRLGWASGPTPAAVELELQKIFPRRQWPQVNQVLVGFGQTICRPRNPKCAECVLQKTCPSSSVTRGAVIAP